MTVDQAFMEPAPTQVSRYAYDAQDPEMEIIEAYIEHLRRASRSEQTMDRRRELLYRLNRELPFGVGAVSTEDLAAWLYKDQWSQNTRATYYRGIKSFYTWASDPADPWLDQNPATSLERVSNPESIARAATDEQVRIILTRAAEPIRMWATIAAYQGLRCIEISRLDREHVTEQHLIVMRGKGNRPRVHDTDPAVWAVLKDLPPGPIALDLAGARATAHDVSMRAQHHFHRHLRINTSMHRLRHWLGTTVQREYRDIRVTQAVLGHKSLASTQIYTQATDEQQRAARATLPRFS